MLRLLKDTGIALWQAIEDTIIHDGVEHAGYLAFLGLLALFPFLVFLFSIAGFFGETAIGVQFVEIMLEQLPTDVTRAVMPRIDEIVSGPPQGLMTLAIVGAIWTASSMVEGLRTPLNRAYRVQTPPTYLLRRLLSIVQFLVITFVVSVGMMIVVLWPLLLEQLQQWVESDYVLVLGKFVEQWAHFSVWFSGAALFLMVAAIYYVIPNIRQTLSAIVPGAVTVAIAWTGAAVLFSKYLRNFDQVTTIYGSLEGVIAFLLFGYIMAVILIFGAEFNYRMEQLRGHKVEQREEGREEERTDNDTAT